MKKLILFLTLAAPLLFGSCTKIDDGYIPTGDSKTYHLVSVTDPGISGTAVFTENRDGSTTITLDLQGTKAGKSHPAHIHANSAAQGSAILIDLTPVIGTTGLSVTHVQSFNDGTGITYNELLDFDGYLNVHLSKDNVLKLQSTVMI